jgi:hypothetical protein
MSKGVWASADSFGVGWEAGRGQGSLGVWGGWSEWTDRRRREEVGRPKDVGVRKRRAVVRADRENMVVDRSIDGGRWRSSRGERRRGASEGGYRSFLVSI